MARLTSNCCTIFFLCLLLGNEIAHGAYRPNPKLLTRSRRAAEETERSTKQPSEIAPITETESKENNLEKLNPNENINLYNTNSNIGNKNNTHQKYDLNNRGNLKYRNLKQLQKNSGDINRTQFVKNVTSPKIADVQQAQAIVSTLAPAAVTEKILETANLENVDFSNSEDKHRKTDLEINVDKYTSPNFHDINNVYIQKSEDSSYVLDRNKTQELNVGHIEQHRTPEYGSLILSTPKSEIFDKRYKQVQDSIRENIKDSESVTEHIRENETVFDFDKLEVSPSDNNTKVYFNITKVTDVEYKDSSESGSNKKEYVSGNGTNINYESLYIKGEENEVEEATSKAPERVVISLSSSLHPVIINSSSVTEAATTEGTKKPEITVREVFSNTSSDNQIQETVANDATEVARVEISLKTNSVKYQNTGEATTTQSTREQKSYYVSTSSPLDPTREKQIDTKSSNEITVSESSHIKSDSLKYSGDTSNLSNSNDMTIPSTAEVWALAGMKDVPPSRKTTVTTSEVPSNIKQLADWSEIVKSSNNSVDDDDTSTTISNHVEISTTASPKENLAQENHIYTVHILPPVSETTTTEESIEVTTKYDNDYTTLINVDEITTPENIDVSTSSSSEDPSKVEEVSEKSLKIVTTDNPKDTTDATEVTTLIESFNVTEGNSITYIDNVSHISSPTASESLGSNKETTLQEDTATDSDSFADTKDLFTTETDTESPTSEKSPIDSTIYSLTSIDTMSTENIKEIDVSTTSDNVDTESVTTPTYIEESTTIKENIVATTSEHPSSAISTVEVTTEPTPTLPTDNWTFAENTTDKEDVVVSTSEYPSSTISAVEVTAAPDTTPTPTLPTDNWTSTDNSMSSSESYTEITTNQPEDVTTTETVTTEENIPELTTTTLDETVSTTEQTLMDEYTTIMVENSNKHIQTDKFEDNSIFYSTTPKSDGSSVTISSYISESVSPTKEINQTIPTTLSSTKVSTNGLDPEFIDENSGSDEREYDNGLTPETNLNTNVTSKEDVVISKTPPTTKYEEDNSITENNVILEKTTESNIDISDVIHKSTSGIPAPNATVITEFKRITQDPNDVDYRDTVTKVDATTETATDLQQEMNRENPDNTGTIAAIVISVVGVIALVVLVALLYVMRKRQKRMTYGQRCTPVSLDAYSLDSVSVYNSMRRKGVLRASKRSYGNPAFEDSGMTSHPMNFAAMANFVTDAEAVKNEFLDIPQVTVRSDEIPPGCDVKNRYANVIPLPETRVHLKQIGEDATSDYINANYVRGPKNSRNYYIACQAPMQSTVNDFWRMIWEEQSRLILMVTDLYENGVEKCVDYLPPSEVLDCHRLFGDFKITLKKREVKDKYVISSVHLRNMESGTWREVTHIWYMWPEKGVPSECHSMIAFLIEARSFMKTSSVTATSNSISPVLFDDSETIEENEVKEYSSAKAENKTNGIDKTATENEKNILKSETNDTKANDKDIKNEKNGKRVETNEKKPSKTNVGDNMPNMGPVVVHCSPGTGRTGTVIACDLSIREFELTRMVDVPKTVYRIRRDRASAVQTKEQYAFVYEVLNLYATKLTGGILDSI